MDDEEFGPKDLILSIFVTDDQAEYSLVVKSADGSAIDSNQFILEVEMWLHEVSQAEINRRAPGTRIH